MSISPVDVLVLDFETYYDDEYSLKNMLAMDYVEDERFKIHNCAFIKNEGKPFVLEGDELNEYIRDVDWRRTTVIAHNVWFDGEILQNHYGVRPRFYVCTQMLAQMRVKHVVGSASLEATARHYGFGGKKAGALDKAKGVRDLPPDISALLKIYAKRDAVLCKKIFEVARVGLSCDELEVIDLHCKMVLDRSLSIDPDHLRISLETVENTKNETYEQIAEWYDLDVANVPGLVRKDEWYAAKLRELNVEPPTRRSPTDEEKRIYDFRKDSLAFTALRAVSEEVDTLITARLYAKSTTVETRIRTLLAVSKDGTRPIPVPLRYGGARTLRSSGTWKMNMQNLKGGDEIRPGVIAPKGKMLVIGDSGQIEARVNAWFSGQMDLLKVFHEGGDPYIWQAEKVYNRPLTKEDNPKERFLGKTIVLGLGFGMGVTRFHQTCLSKRQDVSYELAENAVSIYRRSNRAITNMWKRVERALIRARQLHTEVAVGCVAFWYDELKEIGGIRLPNGTNILYPKLDYDEETNQLSYRSTMYTEAPINLWGGKIIENIVQALARIAVYLQALRLHHSWQIVLLVHDEIVLCVDEEQAKAAQAELDKALATTPEGFEGLPLIGETVISKRYTKP